MQIRLSGLKGRCDDEGRPLSERLAPLPGDALRRFAAGLREVRLHVDDEDGDPARPATVRVVARRRRGVPLTAAGRGAHALEAARVALERVRRLLRRARGRREALRTRGASA